jgi:hypothetical protein
LERTVSASVEQDLKEGLIASLRRFFVEKIRIFRAHQWTVLAAMWFLAFLLGFVGFRKYFAATGEIRSTWDVLYLTLQLFTVESGSVTGKLSWELEAARLLAPATTLYTAIQALAMIFREQIQRLRMRFFRDHIVICGLGRRGLELARSCRSKGDQVVVIEYDGGNDAIEQCREQGAIVLVGNAADVEMLVEAGVQRACYLVAMCGDDGVNAEIAMDARSLVQGKRSSPLRCIVQIVDAQLLNLLRARETAIGDRDSFRLEFFNVFERGARAILNDHPPIADEREEPPHILVVGLGRMGESLVAHAARSWRHVRRDSGGHIKITIIDRDADKKREYIQLNFPLLEKICDLKAVAMDVRSPEFHRAEFLYDSHGRMDVTSIYICLDNDSLAMAASLVLHERTKAHGIPVVVRMTTEQGLARLFQGVKEGVDGAGALSVFGLFDRTCTRHLILGGTREILARDIHEEYLAKENVLLKDLKREKAGAPWEDLPGSFRETFRAQADHVVTMLREVGCLVQPLTDWDAEWFQFESDEIELLAKLEHDHHWRKNLARQWIFMPGYELLNTNEVFDPAPWDKRSEETRKFYRSVIWYLPVFLAQEDFQIRRVRN